ncbi:MAG: glycosyltransferase family 2 protein, partial [Acidiferrobacterales bacterium]
MNTKRTSICGFSFGKNLVTLSYPVVESVRSILPICDRFVFAVGKSDDGTRALVESIDPKVELIDTEWPDVKV